MKRYKLRHIPLSDKLTALSTYLGSEVLARVYWSKGIESVDDLNEYLNDTELLPVDELHDLESFWKVFKRHMDSNSKIVIYGDYDADGAVASSILWRFFSKSLKLNSTIYIPDRHEEGYGLNKDAILSLANQGLGLLISVDCGVRDAKLIKEIKSKTNLDILITDHHKPGDDFPEVPVVHPLHVDKESKNSITSGGVVAWKIVRFLEHKLGLDSSASDSLIDIAGISLVTDIMPIVGENKAILRRAIERLKTSPNVGISALMQHAQVVPEKLATYHLGYVIGPRLNANGRIGDQYASSRLMCTDKKDFAYSQAQSIHEVNVRRQDLTKDMYSRAQQNMKKLDGKLIVVAEDNFDDGIIGLVAGRLMNNYDLPTIVISKDSDKKIAKGSARSFGEFDITGFLKKLENHLDRYGGHHNAAGFSLPLQNLNKLVDSMTLLLAEEYTDYKPVVEKFVEAKVTAKELTDTFFDGIVKLEPFGHDNEAPIFAVEGKIMQFNYIGADGRHVKYIVESDGGSITVLDFNGVDAAKGIEQGDSRIFYGEPKQDEFRGQQQISFITQHHEPIEVE